MTTGAARVHILIAAVLFGTTGTAQAIGPRLDPLAVGASRIVAGAAALAIVALLSGGMRRAGGNPSLVLVAGACVAVYQTSFFAAIDDTGVAIGTVVALGSAPAFTGLVGRLFAGERLGARWVAATALACAGVALLVLGGGPGGSVSGAGVGLALLAGAGYSGYAVAVKRLLDSGGSPVAVMASVFGTGAVLLLPIFVLVPASGLLTPGGLTLALYLGVVPTALAYLLFARGLSRIAASETATLTLAEPLTATLLGVIALGERPGLAAATGATLVLSGLALLALPPGRSARPPRRAEVSYGSAHG